MNPFKSEFTRITKKAIKRYAKWYHTTPENTQLSMHLDLSEEKPTVSFKTRVNYEIKENDVDFTEGILGTKIDFMGYSLMMPPYIQNKLIELCEVFSIKPERIWALLVFVNDDITIWLYDGNKLVKELTVDEITSGESVAI